MHLFSDFLFISVSVFALLAVCGGYIGEFLRPDRWSAWLHPETRLGNIQTDWGVFAANNLPLSDNPRRALFNHLLQEVDEFEEHLTASEESGHTGDAMFREMQEELSDIVIVALHLGYKLRLDLEDGVLTKLTKLKTRKWSAPDPVTGIVHHVEEQA